MSSKHFINDPTHLVLTALGSIPFTNPAVAFDADNKIIYRRPTSNSSPTVSIISGGGSGHEPSFAAFVGEGLLAGAVAGTIFASPSAEQVRKCILGRVDKEKGVLVVVMNYTGDVLNFGVAVEKAKATGVAVEMVVVGDDVGVGREKGGKVGRRGIAGTVLVQKISGALAQTGASLKDVTNIAQLVSDNIVSIGSSLSHVHVPGRDVEVSPDDLQQSEVEIGMGIHNEAGSERKTADLPDLVKTMLAHLLDSNDKDRSFLDFNESDETVLLVNNLGGVSVLELGGITHEVVVQLERDWKIRPVRVLAGTFMTSLNGLGFSITLLRLRDTGLGKSMLQLLDAPAEATGWSAAIQTGTWGAKNTATREDEQGIEGKDVVSGFSMDPSQAKKALQSGLNKVIASEPEITNYDTIVGDGDCGIGLKRGAESVLKLLEKTKTEVASDPLTLLSNITKVVETSMDGTSGALYSIFLNALQTSLSSLGPADQGEKTPITPKVWGQALEGSLKALSKYTPAQPGDRTLVDALVPFVTTLAKTGNTSEAAKAADEGAKATKELKASLGRTVYVGGEGWQGVPDPGAYGLAEILTGLVEGL